jgi:DNA-binding LytR/AlgR family response regulator
LEEDVSQFDLIFLDIYMNGLDGIATAHRIRKMDSTTPIVFLTISSEHAIEGYDVHASGYLLKPLNEHKLNVLLSRLLTPADRPRIAIRCIGGMRYFFIDEIVWIESDKHSLMLHLSDGTTARTNAKLSTIEESLGDSRFLRCHQSYLVNMDHVADVQEFFIMKDGSRVPIRVRSRKAITDAYHSYFVAHTVSLLPGEDVYV